MYSMAHKENSAKEEEVRQASQLSLRSRSSSQKLQTTTCTCTCSFHANKMQKETELTTPWRLGPLGKLALEPKALNAACKVAVSAVAKRCASMFKRLACSGEGPGAAPVRAFWKSNRGKAHVMVRETNAMHCSGHQLLALKTSQHDRQADI